VIERLGGAKPWRLQTALAQARPRFFPQTIARCKLLASCPATRTLLRYVRLIVKSFIRALHPFAGAIFSSARKLAVDVYGRSTAIIADLVTNFNQAMASSCP
jgi:hypothetical protein